MSAAVPVNPVALVLSEDQAENALNLLDEKEHAKLETISGEIHQVVRQTATMIQRPLTSALEAHNLTNLLGRGAKMTKELEALRKAHVGPLNLEVKNVNALFAVITDQIAALDARARRLLVAWNEQEAARVAREQEEARRRQEEAARAEAEAMARLEAAQTEETRRAAMEQAEAASRQQTAAVLSTPLQAPRAYKSDHATASTRERWVCQVVRPDLVPREYLVPSEQAIRAAVAAGVREIPGVSISQEKSITVRGR